MLDVNVILAGDFNCMMNSEMDNICGNPHSNIEINTLNNLSGGSRGGGRGGHGGRAPPFQIFFKNEDLFFYNFVVKNVLFANIYIQYSLTKYGFWSTSEV